MAVLPAAASPEKVRPANRGNHIGSALGNLAFSPGLSLLLNGNGPCDGRGTADYLHSPGNLLCLGLYENAEYLGSGNPAFPEQ